MAPKMPFLQCGLKRKKMAGYHPDLHAQTAGGCVYNTDDPYKFELSPTDAAEFDSVRKIKFFSPNGVSNSSSSVC